MDEESLPEGMPSVGEMLDETFAVHRKSLLRIEKSQVETNQRLERLEESQVETNQRLERLEKSQRGTNEALSGHRELLEGIASKLDQLTA